MRKYPPYAFTHRHIRAESYARMRLLAPLLTLILVCISLVVPIVALQCKTDEGAMMLLYRLCASDFQCSTENQITVDNIIEGASLSIENIRSHNEGYQILRNVVSFLQLVRGPGNNSVDPEADFAKATISDAQLRESDIFYAIWKPEMAAQLPRIFYGGDVDCSYMAMSSDPVPRTVMSEYLLTVYALNTYHNEIAAPPECNNMNEDRLLDASTGEYYCSCRLGKVCTESDQLIHVRVVLLAVIAGVAIVVCFFIIWRGGKVLYDVDKLEAVIAEHQNVAYQ